MTRLRDIDELINHIREKIKDKNDNGKVVFDYHVAQELGISNAALAKCKNRYTLPLGAIINYCIEQNVSTDEVLLTND